MNLISLILENAPSVQRLANTMSYLHQLFIHSAYITLSVRYYQTTLVNI